MQAVTIIGFNIAKSVFQVHGVDAEAVRLMPPAYVKPYVKRQ
jgi:hypothetical protein